MKPKVAIIIVNWNGKKDTLECLNSLQRDLYSNKEIIIVDNASSDGSIESIERSGFNVKLVRSSRNLGFTGGNNLGLIEAQKYGVRYAFLLNNDTTVEPRALSALVEVAEERPSDAILSPVIHYSDVPAEIWFAGATLRINRGEALHDLSLVPGRLSETYTSPWVSGCAMLIRMVAVDQVGGFDERFFLNWEDVDLCVRMRKAGWEVSVVPRSRIYHKVGRSQLKLHGINSYYSVRNSLLLSIKHAGFGYFPAVLSVMLRHFREAMRSSGSKRKEMCRTTIEGFYDHLIGRYGQRGVEASVLPKISSEPGVELAA
ncbi:MAG: glycosyltransferase family 2 protein [Verrucomicrobiota bacterium]